MKIRYSHNCYAYALNDINNDLLDICENKFCRGVNPQPGHYCNSNFIVNTCYQLKARMLCDNPYIYEIDFDTKCKKKYYKIGLASQTNMLYHFYRQNSYGLWDHKDGGMKTSMYDSNNLVIINPELSNRNYDKYRNYNIWCGFFCVPINSHIKTNMSRIHKKNLLY